MDGKGTGGQMYNRKKRPEKIVSVPDEVKAELAEVVKQGFISTYGQSIPEGTKRNDVINKHLNTIPSEQRNSAAWKSCWLSASRQRISIQRRTIFFYNLLYGLVFSLFIPLYCLYKEVSFGHPIMPYGNVLPLPFGLSGNNLIVSLFVNLPNAFVTYILKYEQFPVMGVSSTIAAVAALVLIGLILLLYWNADQRIRRQ